MLLGVRFLGYKVQSNGRVKCDYRGNPIGDPNPQINLECSVKGCGHDVLVYLWLCVPCCKIVCLRHVQQHSERKRQDGRSTHIVFLSCNDTHIFCLKCNQFLYPREVSLNTSQEQEHFLTDFAFHWLQIFGRTRLVCMCMCTCVCKYITHCSCNENIMHTYIIHIHTSFTHAHTSGGVISQR
jgi:hypothetical protein